MAWLVHRLQPREGWGTFLLLLATVLCLPAAAIMAEWVPGDEGLMPLALVALLVGRALAWREDWGRSVWLGVGGSLGLLGALSTAAHAVLFLPGGGEATFNFAQRWVVWLEAAFSRGSSDDPDVFLFYAALLCWTAVLLSVWAFYNRRLPLLALLPLAILSGISVFYSGEGILWLIGQLGCGILLLAIGHLTSIRRTWEARGVDYATDLSFQVVAVAGLVAAVFALVSMVGPEVSVRRISDWFWRTFEEPSARVEDTAGRLFGGVNPPERPSGGVTGGRGASGYLPQSRLLGGRPELLEEVVMVVQTDEPPPAPPEIHYEGPPETPRHYWLGATMDYYSGQGWSATVDSTEEVEGNLLLPPPPAYREVEQHYEFIAPHGDTLYALNSPARIEERVQAVWRTTPTSDAPVPPQLPPPVPPKLPAPVPGASLEGTTSAGGEKLGDLARLSSTVVSYTVVSRLPTPTGEDLRAVPPLYPPEIVEHYLQLPDTLPLRVVTLAREVVTEGQTVYERARLLERYLRSYPYSLEVERPPADRDAVDYFLFDVREGYCDYYATAFVVMARAVGIPTRMASGFVGGEYGYDRGAYLVRELNGHSWPEVYFPGWGWIGFEPTGTQPVTVLSEESSLPGEGLPGPVGPPARVIRSRWRLAGLGVALMAGLAFALAALVRRYRRQRVEVVTLAVVWGWVELDGARMGLSPDPALTPQEYTTSLAMELHHRAERTKRWHAHWSGLAARGRAMLAHLASLYNAQVYGGAQGTTVDEETARGLWAGLRRPLRWFKWLGWVQRRRTRPMRQTDPGGR